MFKTKRKYYAERANKTLNRSRIRAKKICEWHTQPDKRMRKSEKQIINEWRKEK